MLQANLNGRVIISNYRREFMRKLGKSKYGENSNSAKLSNKEARNIIELYSTGNYTYRSLGKIFNVAHTQIGRIIRRESFKKI